MELVLETYSNNFTVIISTLYYSKILMTNDAYSVSRVKDDTMAQKKRCSTMEHLFLVLCFKFT
jgi:hypothetical protein